MRIFFYSCLIALVGLAEFVTPHSPAVAQTSIKVFVNGDIITSYDIAQRGRLLPLFGIKGGESAATDQLIDDTLKFQEGRRVGLRIPDERVDRAYASMAQDRKLNASQLTRELGKMGISADTVKRWIKSQMVWRRLVQDRVRREGQVKTSDIMSAMLERGSPDEITMTEYRLQQIIFVAPSGSSAKYLAQRRREAERYRQNYPGCEGGLAQAKTLKDVVVRDLGRRDSSQLTGAQGDEIKSTTPGQTIRPFQSESGIELIAVCSQREFQSNAAVLRDVENRLKFEQAEDLGVDYLESLRKAAIIERR